MKSSKHLFVVIACLVSVVGLVTSDAQAALLVTYDFSNPFQSGGQPSTAATFVTAGVSASPIVRGIGLGPLAGDSSINSNGFTLATSPDANDYYEFVVGPTGASPLSLDSLEFTSRRSSAGPRAISIVALPSGGSAITLQTIALANSEANFRTIVGLTATAALQNLVAPLTFRIFGYDADLAVGTYRIGLDTSATGSNLPPNLQLFGTVATTTPVPEPSTIAMAGMGVVVLCGYGWRRRAV